MAMFVYIRGVKFGMNADEFIIDLEHTLTAVALSVYIRKFLPDSFFSRG